MPPDATVIDALTDKSASEKKGETLNLDTKVKIDGKEVSVADLVASHKKAAEMQGQLAAAQRTLEAAKVLYGKGSPTASSAETAYRQLLQDAGRTPEEIDAEIAATKGTQQKETAPQGGTQQPPVTQQKDPIGKEDRQTLKLLQQATTLQVTENMRAESEKALLANADFRAYMKHIEERDGEEAAKGFLDSNVKQAYNTLQMSVSAALDKSDDVSIVFGEKLTKAAKDAVGEVVGKARQYLGDPKRLGKSAGIHSGEDPFQLSDKPVDRPRYTPGMSSADLDSQFENRMTDVLMRSVKASIDKNPSV